MLSVYFGLKLLFFRVTDVTTVTRELVHGTGVANLTYVRLGLFYSTVSSTGTI